MGPASGWSGVGVGESAEHGRLSGIGCGHVESHVGASVPGSWLGVPLFSDVGSSEGEVRLSEGQCSGGGGAPEGSRTFGGGGWSRGIRDSSLDEMLATIMQDSLEDDVGVTLACDAALRSPQLRASGIVHTGRRERRPRRREYWPSSVDGKSGSAGREGFPGSVGGLSGAQAGGDLGRSSCSSLALEQVRGPVPGCGGGIGGSKLFQPATSAILRHKHRLQHLQACFLDGGGSTSSVPSAQSLRQSLEVLTQQRALETRGSKVHPTVEEIGGRFVLRQSERFSTSRGSRGRSGPIAMAASAVRQSLDRGGAAVHGSPDAARRSAEAVRRSLETARRRARHNAMVDGIAQAVSFNPLFGMLAQGRESAESLPSTRYHGDSLMAIEELPEGMVLLSESCQLEKCFSAAGKEKDRDESCVPENVFGIALTNPVRAAAIKTTTHAAFDNIMSAAIVVSCMAMTLEHPRLDEHSRTALVLKDVNLALTIVFGCECLLKVFTFSPLGYWKRTSNKIDAVIVVFSVLLMLFESSGFAFVKSLRTLRAVKALRMATRSEGMQHLVSLMVNSVSSMVNVTLLLVMCVAIFGILAVQLYSGVYYRCNDVTVAGVEECIGSYTDEFGQAVERKWTRPHYNFDNLGNALLSLFVCATLDGYGPIMQDAIAAPIAKGMQPQPGTNRAAALFFVAYFLVTVFVMLSMYVGEPLSTRTLQAFLIHHRNIPRKASMETLSSGSKTWEHPSWRH
jgi:hypothetical protein